jgi:hypothetical protein
MRRLFLHIGAHKTGSTALQLGLHRNRARLEGQGVAYVSDPSVAHVHNHLASSQPGQPVPEGFRVSNPDAFAALLAQPGKDMIIASSENFSFFFQHDPIADLHRSLAPHFDEIRILSYLRRQDRHAASHHLEGARPQRRAEAALWGNALTALPNPTPAHDLYLDYDRRIGLWADVFGQEHVKLRIYERELLFNGDIFSDFLTWIGLDEAGMAAAGERNLSLGAAQSKAGHLMVGMGINAKVMAAVQERIINDGRMLPSQDQARDFLARYRDGNRRLNARFALGPQPDLFDDRFDDFPPTPQSDWTDEGATSALSAALFQLVEVNPAFDALTPDDLRIAAYALQSRHPEIAHRLINAAFALRPTGPAILKLKAELDEKLS